MDSNNTPPTASNTPSTQAPSETNGLAVAALITGLLGMGIVPLILGILGLKKPGGRGMSIAGIVLGALQIILYIVIFIMMVLGIAAFGNEASKQAKNSTSSSDSVLDPNAKKDFAQGETGKFGKFDVKVNSVQRNYVPADEYDRAEAGKELIVLDLSVTNNSKDSEYISEYDLKVDVNGSEETPAFADAPGTAFDGGSLASGANKAGQLVYEVPAGAQNMKLVFEATDFGMINGKFQTVKNKYSLAL